MLPFNQIPIQIGTPGTYIEVDNTRAVQGLVVQPHKILVVGQRLETGSVANGVPKRFLSGDQAEEFWGPGSQLAEMCKAIKRANPYTETVGVGLDDPDDIASATGTVTFEGTATRGGVYNFYIAGTRVRVRVLADDDETAIATALAAAISADYTLPVTADSEDGVVTLTARHAGELGNFIDLRDNYYFGDRTPLGITATIAGMADGEGNPDFGDVIDAVGDEQYNTVIMPYTDEENLDLLEEWLANRFGPMLMKEGHAFAGHYGSHAEASTLGSGRNSPHLDIIPTQKSPTPPWIVAAIVGAVDAFEPDPARPRQTLLLPGMLAPKESDRYTREERDIHILTDGLATVLADAGGNMRIERLTTTYKTNALDIPDISFRDTETLRTIAYLRYTVRARFGLRYPRHKLADDGTKFAPGQLMITPKIARAEILTLFREWEAAGLAEDYEQFDRDLIVQRNSEDPNRLDAIIPPNTINQFRVFAAQIQFRL